MCIHDEPVNHVNLFQNCCGMHCRSATCIFYLVLRALDTVEDDMNIPVERKAVMLKEFHKHLYETDWSFMESSEKDKAVLEEFPVVIILMYMIVWFSRALKVQGALSCNTLLFECHILLYFTK